MQIQVPTARFIAKRDPSLAWIIHIHTKALETLLLRNDHFAIEVASKLLNYRIRLYGYKEGVIRYNGRWAVDRHGKALRDRYGNKVPNNQYYDRVMEAKAKGLL